MNNPENLTIYHRFAPLYDRLMRTWTSASRRKAIALLDLKPEERLLVSGVGTGLDLPYLPGSICTAAVDLSPDMLSRAQGKSLGPVEFYVMDAQALTFPNGCFDAVLLNLILSVVPDGKIALEEAWRVLRPGGRIAVFDKFLPEGERLSPLRKLAGALIRRIGTDPNRRLSDMLADLPQAVILRDDPALLRGQYRVILLKKPSS